MAPLSRRSAAMGDADLEAPLNPSSPHNPPSSKHTSVSLSNPVCYMRPRDERAERWHDGVAGGVVSLYSVRMACADTGRVRVRVTPRSLRTVRTGLLRAVRTRGAGQLALGGGTAVRTPYTYVPASDVPYVPPTVAPQSWRTPSSPSPPSPS
eukprot:scaffold6806_cov63-Phaeocystis_antarctica.AAC.1